MSLMEDLTKLYGVERQLRGLRGRLESAQRYFDGQSQLLVEVGQRLEELHTRKRHLKAKIANLETEGASLDEQLEKYRNDLNGAATNKQYTAVLTELNTVKEKRSKLDDSILEAMSEIESLAEETDEVEAGRAERGKVRDLAEGQLNERREDIGLRLTELEGERASAASAIPPKDLCTFEDLSETFDGEAMATVEEIDRRHREYACGACNMHVPFQSVSALMGPNSGLVRCTSCGRILYIQEDVRAALVK